MSAGEVGKGGEGRGGKAEECCLKGGEGKGNGAVRRDGRGEGRKGSMVKSEGMGKTIGEGVMGTQIELSELFGVSGVDDMEEGSD